MHVGNFVGEEALERGLLEVQDLKSGEQKTYPIEDVIALLQDS